jgi:hypothetical protein
MGTVNWLNPTSADWLKVKVGDTRVDLTGGFLPWIRLEEQLRQGRITSSTTGREMALEGGVGKMSPGDIALRFTRSKMAPQTGAIWDIAFRRHFPVGNPITTRGQQAKTLAQAGVPLGPQDVVQFWRQKHNPLGTAATAAMTTFGVGTQTYPDKKPGEDAVKTAQDDMTKYGLGKLGPKTTAEVKAKAAYHDDIIHATSYVDKMKIQTAEYARQHGGQVNMDPVNKILAIRDSKLREAAAKRQYNDNVPYVTFPYVEALDKKVHEAEDKQLDAKLRATRNGSH